MLRNNKAHETPLCLKKALQNNTWPTTPARTTENAENLAPVGTTKKIHQQTIRWTQISQGDMRNAGGVLNNHVSSCTIPKFTKKVCMISNN